MLTPSFLLHSGLVSSVAYLCVAYDTSFAFNRPVQSSVICLAITGFILIFVSLVFPGCFVVSAPPPDYHSIPLTENGNGHATAPRKASLSGTSERTSDERFYGLRRLRFTFVLLIAAICLRIEAARHVITHAQCAGFSSAPFIPLFITVYIAWISRSAADRTGTSESGGAGLLHSLVRGRWQHFIPSTLLTWAAAQVFTSVSVLRSTYICPLVFSWRTAVPVWQAAATCLDALIIIWILELTYRGPPGHTKASSKSAMVIGWAFFISGTLLIFVGLGVYFGLPSYREWVGGRPRIYMLDSFRIIFAFATAVLCAIQVLARTSTHVLAATILFSTSNVVALSVAWANRDNFAPLSALSVISALVIGSVGLFWTVLVDSSLHLGAPATSTGATSRIPKTLLGLLVLVLVLQGWAWTSRTSPSINVHPIEVLMAQAADRHEEYVKNATKSSSLAEAAATYRIKYNRDPPPRFDKWYNYTRQLNPTIIDDFDSIYEDLLPFWSMAPGEIRYRTWESMSNPQNWIGGIIIRKGKFSIAPHVPDSHRWMLDGVINMMTPFVRWLPDMDLAFNLNDESRVAVPYDEIEEMRAAGRKVKQLPRREDGDFNPSRDKDWRGVPMEPIPESRFHDETLKASFYTYGSVACPPWAKARRERHWTVQSHCASCAAPHSLGQFVSNWSLAGDPCHQPDLADLHGFYLAPATFVNTHDLMPVFSQSKVEGYHDILYPSAWNYEDKAKYAPDAEFPDMPYLDKDSLLFWRGGTSEGYGTGYGPWKGMTRQRLVHMFNNATESERSLVLLPESRSDNPTYSYGYFPPSVLHQHLSTSLRIVGKIERCRFRDCDDQLAEFAPQYVTSASFQEHWRYKYLFDADGAGFSGRFLPFLASNSLPFKAALFREWWASRVEAWVHFVPVDLRLTETWSLLAYFAGWPQNPADASSTEYLMPPHDAEGERIARAGKEWAAKVLRKEDMEIYLFRLL